MAANRGRKCVYFIRYGDFHLSAISGKCIGFRHNRDTESFEYIIVREDDSLSKSYASPDMVAFTQNDMMKIALNLGNKVNDEYAKMIYRYVKQIDDLMDWFD